MRPLAEIALYLGLLLQLGIIMAVAIYLGFSLGSWLDGLLGLDFTFTILGSILGVASGFLAVYRLIRNTEMKWKDEDRR